MLGWDIYLLSCRPLSLSAVLRFVCCAEAAAISNMIQHFGTGIFATVMDSYDYEKASLELNLNPAYE